MHSCYYTSIIYGFNEGNNNEYLDIDSLELISDIRMYADGIVRNYMTEAVYGVPCSITLEGEIIGISEEEKREVEKLYTRFIEYHKKNGKDLSNISKLGFYTVLSGDYDMCHESYTLTEENYDEK